MEVASDKLRSRLELIRRGGLVRRFHTVPMLHQETNAEHSFYVAWLLVLLGRADLVYAALEHDLAECFTGDMPSPAKRALGVGARMESLEEEILKMRGHGFVAALSVESLRVLKLADTLAGALTCARELSMGNAPMRKVLDRFSGYAASLVRSELESELFGLCMEDHTNE